MKVKARCWILIKTSLPSLLVALFLLCSYHNLSAQYTIQGEIIDDSTNETLPLANIQVKKNTKTIAFGSSSNDGFFSISLNESGVLLIKTSYIGFESKEVEIAILENQQKSINLEIRLNPTVSTLNSVVIEGQAPEVIIKEDTISYNIEKYVDGTEVSLGELLNKLPGIEVDKGVIKVNGEKVDKLLLDGEEFFINQHQLATENIGAKIVDGIDFYNNYEDLSTFKGFSNNKVKALNIGIKEEYKNKITGNISAGGGINEKYTGHANLFRFGKKLNFSFIGDVNNTGQKSLTIIDYLNTTDPSQFSNSSNKTIDISEGLNTILFAEDNVAERVSELGTMNISIRPTKRLKIYLYSILSHSKQKISSSSTRNLFSTGREVVNNNNQLLRDDLIFNNSYLNIDYKANNKTLLKYTLNISQYSNMSDISTVNTSSVGNQIFDSKDKHTPFSFNHRAELSKKISKKILLSTHISQRIDDAKNNKILASNNSFLALPFSFTGYNIEQLTNKDEEATDANISLKYKSGKNVFQLEFGGSANRSTFFSKIFEIEPNMSITQIGNSQFSNNFLVNRKTNYVGAFATNSFGLLQYRLGVLSKTYLMNIEQPFSEKFKAKRILPMAELLLKFKESNKLTIRYEMTNTFPNTNNIATGTTINNFQQLTAGQIPFNIISNKHTASLKYMLFDLFSNTALIIFNTFTSENNATSSNTISQENYILTQKRIVSDNTSFRSSIFLDKRMGFFPAKLRLVINYNSNQFYSFVENQQTKNESQNISLKPAVTSLFKSNFNFESGVEVMKNKNKVVNINLSNSFTRLSPYIKLKQKFDNGLLLRLNFKYDKYSTNTNLERELYLLDGIVKYRKEKSRIEYIIRVNNVLNLNSNQRLETSLNQSYLEERIYSSLPGYLLFELKFNL